MPTSDTKISKLLSYVLRHAPQELDLVLDAEGWTDYSELSRKVCEKFGVIDTDIRRMIAENPKKRFTLSGDRVRALRGIRSKSISGSSLSRRPMSSTMAPPAGHGRPSAPPD